MFQTISIIVIQLAAALCDENFYIGAVVEFAPINSYDLSSPVEVNTPNLFPFLNPEIIT